MRQSRWHTPPPTPIAPALVEYDTSRSASPVSTVTVHHPIASPRERKKLSRLIGEVEADSSEEEPLVKKLRSRRSNDGRDEGAVEGPADDDEPAEEPAGDEEPTEEPVDDEEPEEPVDNEEGMVGVDEAPAEGVATRGTKGGGSKSSERSSSSSEEDEDEDDEASEEDELDEDSDSSTRGIRWKGSREERRKAAKMYQDYLKSNKILYSAYKGLNDKSKQKFEACARTVITLFLRAEKPRGSIPLPGCLRRVLRDDADFLPEAACGSEELTLEILRGDNGVRCLTHWWRGKSSSTLAQDRVDAYGPGVKVVDCGCSVDVTVWEFFLLKTFKLTPPHVSFPLLHYDSRDGMADAMKKILGIQSARELFNPNGTGWDDPAHQQKLKERKLASLMADLGQEDVKGIKQEGVKGKKEDVKGKKEESPGPLQDVASTSLAPARRGANSSSRSARGVTTSSKASSSTPTQKKLRSATNKR